MPKPIRTIFSMDIDNWTRDKRPQLDLAHSYCSGGQPPSLGDVRQMVVSEPSGSNPMYSNGQPPSVNDVCRQEPSQSEVSCTRYDGPDEHEVQQQVISELNDQRGAVNRSKDIMEYSGYEERTQDLLSRFSSQFCGVPQMVFNSFDSIKDKVCGPQVQGIGVPQMVFNSSDTIKDGVWGPHVQRIGTCVKVYKSEAITRLVDISAYSGYEELKQDLARKFGIEGQLEDRGWRHFYADRDEDILFVGGDPWQVFVDCVRYIKILSPQEVQQISMDHDFGVKSVLNQV